MDSMAQLLVDAGETLGHETRVFYSVAHISVATKSALKSLRGGLLSVAKHRCIIYPAFLNADPAQFDFVRSGAREEYMAGGGLEAIMPALKPEDLVTKVLGVDGSFSDLAKSDSPLSFGERLFFGRQWLPLAHKAVSTLVDIDEVAP